MPWPHLSFSPFCLVRCSLCVCDAHFSAGALVFSTLIKYAARLSHPHSSHIHNVIGEKEHAHSTFAESERRVFPKSFTPGRIAKRKKREIGALLLSPHAARTERLPDGVYVLCRGRKMRRAPHQKTCCYGGKLIASWFPNRQPNLFSISEQERRELLMAPGISMAALAALMIILEHSLTEHQRVFFVCSHSRRKGLLTSAPKEYWLFSLRLPSTISSIHLVAKSGP